MFRLLRRILKLELQCGNENSPTGQSKLYLLKGQNCLSVLTLVKLTQQLIEITPDTPLTCNTERNPSKPFKHKGDSKSQWICNVTCLRKVKTSCWKIPCFPPCRQKWRWCPQSTLPSPSPHKTNQKSDFSNYTIYLVYNSHYISLQ